MNPYNPYSPPVASPYASPEVATVQAAGVSDKTIELLRKTRPWVLLLGVLGFIGSAFMVLAGLIILVIGGQKGSAKVAGFGALPDWLGLVYLPLAVLYIYPSQKLWGYGKAIGRLTATRAMADLEDALAQQKRFWSFVGWTSLISMVIYALVIIGAVVFGVTSALSRH